jgi:murein DD-endopeptidase MepM/ murein hydrolase activator NlpD
MAKPNQKLIKKLKNRYRLVMINDATFEDKFSISLTPLNLFVGFSSFLVFFAVIIIMLIVFTPIRELIPGYTDTQTKNNVINLAYKTDSLEAVLKNRDYYYKTVLNILKDSIVQEVELQLEKQTPNDKPTDMSKTKVEKEFTKEFESQKEQYNISLNSKKATNQNLFFKPVDGKVSRKFLRNEHPAIDIAAKANDPVKAILDGRVIFTGWNKETGNVLVIQHARNLVSIYKHNAGILKKYGTFVRAGESVSIVGNSGELTNGYHLHLEIWENGTAVDPEKYLNY